MISFVFTLLCCKEKEVNIIKVGYLPIIAHLPASIAKERQYFGDLKVEYVIYSNSNDLLNDLNAGKIDVATTLAVAPIVDLYYYLKSKSNSEDFKMKIFSYSITTSDAPFDGTFVSDSNQIKEMYGLKGKRVGVFPGTTAKNIFAYHLKENYGINKEEVTYINVPPPAQLDALKSGTIDAMFTYETIRTVLEREGFKNISGSIIAQVLENAPYGCSAVNSDFLKENLGSATKFIEGFDKGIEDVKSDPEFARKILVSSLGVSENVANNCNLEKRLKSNELDQNVKIFDNFISLLNLIDSTFNKEIPFSAEQLLLK